MLLVKLSSCSSLSLSPPTTLLLLLLLPTSSSSSFLSVVPSSSLTVTPSKGTWCALLENGAVLELEKHRDGHVAFVVARTLADERDFNNVKDKRHAAFPSHVPELNFKRKICKIKKKKTISQDSNEKKTELLRIPPVNSLLRSDPVSLFSPSFFFFFSFFPYHFEQRSRGLMMWDANRPPACREVQTSVNGSASIELLLVDAADRRTAQLQRRV